MNLDDVAITRQDETLLASKLGNWLGLSKFLVHADEKTTLKLIKLELKGKGRLDIIHRLHAKFNTLRRTREKVELARRLYESR